MDRRVSNSNSADKKSAPVAFLLRMLVALAVLGTSATCDQIQAQTSPTKAPADGQSRLISEKHRRDLIERLERQQTALRRVQAAGQAAFAVLRRDWEAVPATSPMPAIFSARHRPRTPYETVLRQHVIEFNSPWPAAESFFHQQLYVECMLGRLDQHYDNEIAFLEQANTWFANKPPGTLRIADAEARINSIRNQKLQLRDGQCPLQDPTLGMQPKSVGTVPLSVDWGQSCLASDRTPGTGPVGAYQATTAALMYDDGNRIESPYCTGTLIAPNAVLTAAHCVCATGAKDEQGAFYRSASECATGGYRRRARTFSTLDPAHQSVFFQHAGRFKVRSIVLHPQYRWPEASLPSADLAIFILDENVPGIAPAVINTLRRLPPRTPASIVGFGAHNPISDTGRVKSLDVVLETSGLKLQAETHTSQCSSFERARNLICWDYKSERSGVLQGNSCRGDSGGPLFAEHQGRSILVGVTSAGGESCIPGTRSFDTEIYPYAGWIARALAEYPPFLSRGFHMAEATPPINPEQLDATSGQQSTGTRQMACTFCAFCPRYREIKIPDNVRWLRVSINCTPDDLQPRQTVGLSLGRYNRGEPEQPPPQECVGTKDKKDNTTAASCEVAVQGGEDWRIELKTGTLQQCQIVATTFQ
ncbi:MAG: S1 family peptidase [Hyphomicrobiaceae bacterium]